MKINFKRSALWTVRGMVIFLFPLTLFSQDSIWPIVYNSQLASGIIELYDKGFVIVGSTVLPNSPDFDYGIIKKTDINGQQLWQKYIGTVPPPGWTTIDEINPTSDGGYIIAGFTRILNGAGNTFAMKLNSCFEKEWSRIFYSEEGNQASSGICQIENGNYLLEIDYWGDDINKSIWVFKLSATGEIIWQKSFADEWEPGPWSAEVSDDFVPDNQGYFIITGKYYKAEDGMDTNTRWVRPMFIKIDTAGNEIWHLVYVQDFYVGNTFGTDTDSEGIAYSSGENRSPLESGEPLALFKVSNEGNMQWAINLNTESDSVHYGYHPDVSVLNDTILYAVGGWTNNNGVVFTDVFKVDTSGILIDRKFINHNNYLRFHSITTSDDKVAFVTTEATGELPDYYDIHLFKVNYTLDFDTLNNGEITYDSLCDHQILSDTILLDTTTVNLEHLTSIMRYMNVYPNPAIDKVRIEVNIVKWKERQLRVSDLFGREVYHCEILPGSANQEINVKGWPEGLYVFRLYENGRLLQMKKVLIAY